MTSDAATVDVIVPAYNAAPYITSALESITVQTRPVASIIVSDDGSTDGTGDKVHAFKISHPTVHLRYLRNTNSGPAAARNRALEVARAQYIAFLDADDIWLPEKLEHQLSVFDGPTASTLGVVYCDYELMDEEGNPLPNFGFHLDPTIRGDIYNRLIRENLVAGSASAVLMRRACIESVGGFDETLVCAEDWDLWLRIARRYTFDFVPEPLVRLRQHPANAQKNELRMLGGELLFADKLYRSSQLRQGHIWRLRTRLVFSGIDATELHGFGRCQPEIRRAFSGWRMTILGALIRWIHYAKSVMRILRRRLTNSSQTIKSE